MGSTPITAPILDGIGGRAAQAPLPPGHERRHQKRYKLALPGRFMCENKQEHSCRLNDISCTGAAVIAPITVEPGERIVAYIDQIGGLEGFVVRTFDGGFAIQFSITRHKREKLAAQLEALSSRDGTDGVGRRRHERVPVTDTTGLRLAEDICVQVRVLDMSISGASVKTEARPALGSEVVLGKLRAKVVRHHAEGLGLEFIDTQNTDASRRSFR